MVAFSLLKTSFNRWSIKTLTGIIFTHSSEEGTFMVSGKFILLSVSNANLEISHHLLTQVMLVLTLALPETTLSIVKSHAPLEL